VPNLTQAQKTALKNAINANAAQVSYTHPDTGALVTVAINATAADDGTAANAIAAWYNQVATPDFFVWRDLPMEVVLSLITYANMTPADAVPAVTALPANPTAAQNATYNNQMAALHAWNARANLCQGKQFNLQNLTIGRTTAPMKRANYRAALQDCLTNIPAGVAGALVAGNWVGVRDGAKFLATQAEKVLATGTGSQATPADLGYEGGLDPADVVDARANG
jgi:hypothetical protein